MGGNNPGGVCALMNCTEVDTADDGTPALGISACSPHSKALVSAPHRVREVHERRQLAVITGEVHVFRCAHDPPTLSRFDHDDFAGAGSVSSQDARRAEVPAAVVR